jgi:hypothetical protein
VLKYGVALQAFVFKDRHSYLSLLVP